MGKARQILVAACCGLAGVAGVEAAASDAAMDSGFAVCSMATTTINVVADFTTTACVPAGGDAAGRLSFIVIAQHPVFAMEKPKKGWLMLACASIGQQLNERAKLRVHEIWFADTDLMKARTAYSMPAGSCKTLQRKVHGDTMTLDQMYQQMQGQLVKITLPASAVQ